MNNPLECPCGSGLAPDRCRDEAGSGVWACDRCKPDLLFRIFEDRYIDLFEEWAASILSDPPPVGWEWKWEDLLKEKGCEQVVGAESALNRLGFVVIPCPHGESLRPEHQGKRDRSVRIVVPLEYADRVLVAGEMV